MQPLRSTACLMPIPSVNSPPDQPAAVACDKMRPNERRAKCVVAADRFITSTSELAKPVCEAGDSARFLSGDFNVDSLSNSGSREMTAGEPRRDDWRLELLIDRLPSRLGAAVRFLRKPSGRWLRIPVGLLLI